VEAVNQERDGRHGAGRYSMLHICTHTEQGLRAN
jgi:hypothetical protein